MITLLLHVFRLLPLLFGGHRQLALENLALRQQLAVYKRTMPRPRLHAMDRLFWIGLARVWTGWRQALVIVSPDTVLRWQRRRFREYWTQLRAGLLEVVLASIPRSPPSSGRLPRRPGRRPSRDGQAESRASEGEDGPARNDRAGAGGGVCYKDLASQLCDCDPHRSERDSYMALNIEGYSKSICRSGRFWVDNS
jgi:hypothetical protein